MVVGVGGGVDKTQSSTLGRVGWPDDSIMARRGLTGGQVGTTHALTEERQGTFHFTMGPYSSPVLEIQPGDRVTVETRDAFGGVIHTESDLPSATLTMPFVNPQNGPIMVTGERRFRPRQRRRRVQLPMDERSRESHVAPLPLMSRRRDAGLGRARLDTHWICPRSREFV